jgi:hypothetical protein
MMQICHIKVQLYNNAQTTISSRSFPLSAENAVALLHNDMAKDILFSPDQDH